MFNSVEDLDSTRRRRIHSEPELSGSQLPMVIIHTLPLTVNLSIFENIYNSRLTKTGFSRNTYTVLEMLTLYGFDNIPIKIIEDRCFTFYTCLIIMIIII